MAEAVSETPSAEPGTAEPSRNETHDEEPDGRGAGRGRLLTALVVLSVTLVVSVLAGIALGPTVVPPTDVVHFLWAALTGGGIGADEVTGYSIVWHVRTPRVLLASVVGAGLAVVGAVGTGSSTGGLVDPLRERGRAVRLLGVQPFGSVTFGSDGFSDPEAIIAGIGSSIPFDNVRHDLYDTLHWLDFRHAMAGAVGLLREHAVFAGLSTGAAHLVAGWEAARHPERVHVVIGADTGHRYTERVFARHQEALDPSVLKPHQITGLADLAPPWSVMAWERRSYDVRRSAAPARVPAPLAAPTATTADASAATSAGVSAALSTGVSADVSAAVSTAATNKEDRAS
ncbi:pyridoxal-phosphate dependent enzyme [Streptomyces phaeochromogenes]